MAAHPDSDTPAEIRSFLPRRTTGTIGQGATELAHVVEAYESLHDVDVIHDHTLAGPLIGPGCRGVPPVVATHHGTFDDACKRIFRRAGRWTQLVAISQCQAASAGDVPIAAVVHHGVDVADFPFGETGGDYLVFLGRMVPRRARTMPSASPAASACRSAWRPRCARTAEQAFFDAEVEPLLGGDAEYVGELGGREKLDLLAGARALLNPIDWAEPFGMVMLEALACGTPVVGRSLGAAPEIVGPRPGGLPGPDGRRAGRRPRRAWTTSTGSPAGRGRPSGSPWS